MAGFTYGGADTGVTDSFVVSASTPGIPLRIGFETASCAYSAVSVASRSSSATGTDGFAVSESPGRYCVTVRPHGKPDWVTNSVAELW